MMSIEHVQNILFTLKHNKKQGKQL